MFEVIDLDTFFMPFTIELWIMIIGMGITITLIKLIEITITKI